MSDHEDLDMDSFDMPDDEPIAATVVDGYTIMDSHFDQELPGRVGKLKGVLLLK